VKKSTNPKEAKFTAEIDGGQLVVKIGVNVLAFAALRKNGGPLVENERVTDSDQFAKDVLCELSKEEENGDTPLYKLIDQAIRDAAENGCIAIRTLKRKPRET
jgi:hypothetical protein